MTTSNSTEGNKALVLAGIKGVFIDRDPSAVDRLFMPTIASTIRRSRTTLRRSRLCLAFVARLQIRGGPCDGRR